MLSKHAIQMQYQWTMEKAVTGSPCDRTMLRLQESQQEMQIYIIQHAASYL